VNKISKTFQYGKHNVILETGEIARQATASVLVSVEGTVCLVTVVAKKDMKPGQDFFPLTVNYQEKAYAAGKIPGGYFKREGRPAESETLISRLIDRPIRPLFPKEFKNEVQVVVTVMSLNPAVQTDIPAMIGASAALALSGVPFAGPIGAARVGYKDGEYLLNPSEEELKTSDLDLVVAGTQDAVLMVESQANLLPEDVMLESVWYGHEQMQVVINAINEMVEEGGKARWDWVAPEKNTALIDQVKAKVEADVTAAYQISDKMARKEKLDAVRDALIAELCQEGDDTAPAADDVAGIFASIEKNVVRSRILSGEPRIDGRDTRTVRPITIRTGLLPQVHGSVLFTRGETQAIVAATLGTERDSQIIDALSGEFKDRFMLHYNFPPYCVGEAGMMGSPKRREIGHGRLARRGVAAVLPSYEEFPYVLRVVSEITESNGSSSMASVCGTSMALMDAGVPVKTPVAGIAMGLVLDGNRFAVLTDILGDEDHLGDMDFKVAGSDNGVTALQMDIKITGITKFIMQQALDQAREARLHILGKMNEVLSAPREEISSTAPRILTMKVKPEKVREVIGKGGATIKGIIEATGATIDIDDDGVVKIYAVDGDAGRKAIEMVENIVAEAELHKIYEGKVTKLLDFGALVSFLPGKDGLVHISQLSEGRVEKVEDVLQEGQEVRVKVIEIDRQGRVRLSMKPSQLGEEAPAGEETPSDE